MQNRLGKFIKLSHDDHTNLYSSNNQSRYYGSGAPDYLSMVFTPNETSVSCRNEIIHLLVAIGADINHGIKSALAGNCQLTLLDSVREAVNSLSTRIGEEEDKNVDSPASAPHSLGWKGQEADLKRKIKQSEDVSPRKRRVDDLPSLRDMKEYFSQVEMLLVANQAKTWADTHPNHQPVVNQARATILNAENEAGYARMTAGWSNEHVPKHLIPRYDELFEAAFSGDNEKIQQLCLPAEETLLTATPIQISVRTVDQNNSWSRDGMSVSLYIHQLPRLIDFRLHPIICGYRWTPMEYSQTNHGHICGAVLS